MRADVLLRVGPERVPRPAVAPSASATCFMCVRSDAIDALRVFACVASYDEAETPPEPSSSLLALAETHTGDSTTSGEDAQSPRSDRRALRSREIKFRAPRAAPHDDTNASPTSIGSVVDERVAVTPMPLPSPSHRATARAPRVHFAPTEETNS